MLDFLQICKKYPKSGQIELYPKFKVKNRTKDLMIRGGDFYAVWIDEEGRWSTDEDDVITMVDKELKREYESTKDSAEIVTVKYMWDSDSGIIDKWHKYCQKQLRDNYHPLNEKLVFANDKPDRNDYSSKRLNYSLEPCDTPSWDRLMSVLYSPEEAHKLEWSIGSIVTGDSKTLEKFVVLYGAAGTGKSTFLKIVQMLFEGYYTMFDAKALGTASNSFALEPFKANPLVAIQHDGDLSRLEDNTRLNSVVSHEEMTVNEKFTKLYTNRFKAFLFMGTNSPVKITDSKSGLLRRLIDVSPTGTTLGTREYRSIMDKIPFELGGIAFKCRDIYLDDPNYYDDYRPVSMIGATNDFYNYILDYIEIFEGNEITTLNQAWTLYKEYCMDANVPYPYSKRKFKEELKNYFDEFLERHYEDGKSIRNVYRGFILDKFHTESEIDQNYILRFDKTESLLDDELSECYAQYANDDGIPSQKWEKCKTKLKSLNTMRLHYVKVPENHIVIDFDVPDPKTGKKSFKLNLEEASKFPPTYAELSKSGEGIHLHYIYNGNVDELDSIYKEHIEVKVFRGNSSLRRKLTYCNDLPIATISGGLPIKKEGDKQLIDFEGIKDERHLRNIIRKHMRKEVMNNTTPSMQMIEKTLNEAYNSGMHYDISNMYSKLLAFSMSSSNQKDQCMAILDRLKLCSYGITHGDDGGNIIPDIPRADNELHLAFIDVEVVPNLLLICWKAPGPDAPVIRMFNPEPHEVEELFKLDLVGHNLRRFDNHIMYARAMGYGNEALYNLSRHIIKGDDKNVFFANAYGFHYADTLDYPVKTQSLKKWEIELGFPHQEFEMSFDEPLPEKYWDKLADYCENDVRATEAVWDATQPDFRARQIITAISGGRINQTTNTLSGLFIFGKNKHPQSEFIYRNMGDESTIDEEVTQRLLSNFNHKLAYPEFTKFDKNGCPVFPGYEFKNGKSIYRNEDPKEGGYVYSEPGIYGNSALMDIESMHPSSAEDEMIFGPEYTPRMSAIKKTRILIKHGDFAAARKMFDGALAPYLEDEKMAKDLSMALKIVINSIYGLTKAKFDNVFRDPRNKDNIVAKRGALFMINLKHEVQARGFTVAHIKTDSIKIPDATPEILDFVYDYGKLYGYNFEHEDTYERMFLLDKANYAARHYDGTWTTTGDKFGRPYIEKMIITQEDLELKDLQEVKSVTTAIYNDINETCPDVTAEEKELKKLETKYRKGELSDTTFESECARLGPIIAEGHHYTFVGKVGAFVPVKPGCGGGWLMRKNDNGKFGAVEGTKGYRWMEVDMLKAMNREDDIDMTYYDNEVQKILKEMDDVFEKQVAEGRIKDPDIYNPHWFLYDNTQYTLDV